MGGSLSLGHAGGTSAGRNTASSEGRITLTTTHFDPSLRWLGAQVVGRSGGWALRWLGAVRDVPAQRRLNPGARTCQCRASAGTAPAPVSYTHLRAHETVLDLVCRLLL